MPSAFPERAAVPARADDFLRALEELEQYADVLEPKSADEPILAPTVAHAVHEWLVEINNAAELRNVYVHAAKMAQLYVPPRTGQRQQTKPRAAPLSMQLIAVQYERINGSYLGETGRALGDLFRILKP